MPRPAAHTADDLVDAALRLFAVGGARAVTMSAVAAERGAPSGSVYHRFPDRPALLAATWMRTTRRFEEHVEAVLARAPAGEAVTTVAGEVVEWCREHLHEAIALHAGARAFSPDSWSPDARQALADHDKQLQQRLRRLVTDLATATGADPEDLRLALFDLPRAIVGRSLSQGTAPPAGAVRLARRAAGRIVGAVGP